MRRGEQPPKPKLPPDGGDAAPAVGRIARRLFALIGGLTGPEIRWRLWSSFTLTLGGKVLAVFSPLVLADGINRLSRGEGGGAFQLFAGIIGLWAALRFFSTAGPQVRDAIFQPI